jgi:hypothetical protein
MERTTVVIQIFYTSAGDRSYQMGEFPLKGRTWDQAAYDFFRWICRELPYGAELEKVLCEGEDLTEKVKEWNEKETL